MTNSAPVRSRSSTMSTIKSTAIVALAAAAALPQTAAHSWIEEYQVVGSNGSYVGDRGYSRGYMARTDPGYNGFSMDYLVPSVNTRINSTDLLCHPSQRTSNYTNPAYPKLKVQPGGYVAMKYLENGHVTLPWNQLGKPKAGGTVFVYGTTQPSETEQIADVLQWTVNGTGGDGRGFLMTAQNFDDGRCHQINCGNISIARQIAFPDHQIDQPTSTMEQWCETDLKIPASQPAGTLTTYWVWQWPTESNADCTYPEGKDEYYTTCADFDIVNEDSKQLAAAATTNTLAQENPQSTAVPDYMSRVAYTASPPVIMIQNGSRTVGPVTSASSSFLAACSAKGDAAFAVSVSAPASCDAVSVFTGEVYTSAMEAIKADATTGLARAVRVQANIAAPTGSGNAGVGQSTAAATAAAATVAPLTTSVSMPAAATSTIAPSADPMSSPSSSQGLVGTVTVTDSNFITVTMTQTVDGGAASTAPDASAASTTSPASSASNASSSASTASASSDASFTSAGNIYGFKTLLTVSSTAVPTSTSAAVPAKQRRHARAFIAI